jgi:hypothetical protein
MSAAAVVVGPVLTGSPNECHTPASKRSLSPDENSNRMTGEQTAAHDSKVSHHSILLRSHRTGREAGSGFISFPVVGPAAHLLPQLFLMTFLSAFFPNILQFCFLNAAIPFSPPHFCINLPRKKPWSNPSTRKPPRASPSRNPSAP